MTYQHTSTMVYPPCDTFFQEEAPRSYIQAAREQLKLEKRKRQEDMASELSRLTSEEYLEDVVRHMKVMEVRRLDQHRLV